MNKQHMIFMRLPKNMYVDYVHKAERLHMPLSRYAMIRCMANTSKLSRPTLRRLRARYHVVDRDMKYAQDALGVDRYMMANILYLLRHHKDNNTELLKKYLPQDRLAECLKRLHNVEVDMTALPNEIKDIEGVYRRVFKITHKKGSK